MLLDSTNNNNNNNNYYYYNKNKNNNNNNNYINFLLFSISYEHVINFCKQISNCMNFPGIIDYNMIHSFIYFMVPVNTSMKLFFFGQFI